LLPPVGAVGLAVRILVADEPTKRQEKKESDEEEGSKDRRK